MGWSPTFKKIKFKFITFKYFKRKVLLSRKKSGESQRTPRVVASGDKGGHPGITRRDLTGGTVRRLHTHSDLSAQR